MSKNHKYDPTISKIFEYVNGLCQDGQTRLSELYGTENFCWFLYSIVLIRKPKVIVELGAGAACSTALAAYAAKLNGVGHVWAVDDGSDWPLIREDCQKLIGRPNAKESYHQFLARLLKRFEISDQVTVVNQTLSDTYFAPPDPIDVLFLDLGDPGPLGCLSMLRYYLSKISRSSSIFIDRASTVLPSRLLLTDIFDNLNRGRVPKSLVEGLDPASVASIKALSETCRFTLAHLVEPHEKKVNAMQNSRLWISVEEEDFLAPNGVDTFLDFTIEPIRVS